MFDWLCLSFGSGSVAAGMTKWQRRGSTHFDQVAETLVLILDVFVDSL